MADAKAQTFVDTIMCLYQRGNVNVRKLVGTSTDGCSTMKKVKNSFQAEAGISIIWCHCLAHSVNLAFSEDTWKMLHLCKEVTEAMRAAYSIFNRSSQRIKELQAFAREFGRVRVPAALHDIRWLSMLQCLEVFASAETSEELMEYINAEHPDRVTIGENKVSDRLS